MFQCGAIPQTASSSSSAHSDTVSFGQNMCLRHRRLQLRNRKSDKQLPISQSHRSNNTKPTKNGRLAVVERTVCRCD